MLSTLLLKQYQCDNNEHIYVYVITCLRVLYQIYNHLALGPMALMLSDYKSDIALVGVL